MDSTGTRLQESISDTNVSQSGFQTMKTDKTTQRGRVKTEGLICWQSNAWNFTLRKRNCVLRNWTNVVFCLKLIKSNLFLSYLSTFTQTLEDFTPSLSPSLYNLSNTLIMSLPRKIQCRIYMNAVILSQSVSLPFLHWVCLVRDEIDYLLQGKGRPDW